MSKITVSKNGETREFSTEMWNALPPNKYGWVAAAEVPEEVKALQEEVKDDNLVAKEKPKADGKAQK